ncbi:hypothetical protein LRAMOSA10144 [Lichtheimia ramosa]|uniref:DUF4604 domain-containing protein n=1 Tax=Lichtheimia ramosa TaxID=688394 RepID=A0A077WNT0_9FUNG|nr:hypothetical protein LRAMOSA10144 [Lichtheimia ramosa]
MPPKQLTPHQVSKGLSYVHKEAPFLAKLKSERQGEVKRQARFQDYEDGQDDADYDELEEIHENETKDEDEDEDEKQPSDNEREDKPAVDENGRILFRAKKRKASSNDKNETQESSSSAKKPKKKKKKVIKLSFDGDEDE